MTTLDTRAEEALHRHFGHPGFRPGQREAVEAAMAGRDVLVVMPTGAGKSLCYQLPALEDSEALTLVVSPLVSLMQDQVEGLGDRAELINAQRTGAENAESLRRALAGEARMLYVAPERFWAPGIGEKLKGNVGPVRRGRGPLRQPVGPRLPPRVLQARRDREASGSAIDPRRDRDGDAARSPWTSSTASAWTTRSGSPPGSSGRTSPTTSSPISGERARERAVSALLSEPDALPAIVYSGTRSAPTRRRSG